MRGFLNRIAVVAVVVAASAANASPGPDAVADAATCTSKDNGFPNPEMQAACTKCVAQKGKHYHYYMELCHAEKAPPPPPPATIESTVQCGKWFASPGQDKKQEQCSSCLSDDDHVFRGGKCVTLPDLDPAKMASKPLLDKAECSIAGIKTPAVSGDCSKCVGAGGTYHLATQRCAGAGLPDTTPAIVDAKSCRDKTVAKERRLRCLACTKAAYNSFALVGIDAGQCVRDNWKFVDTHKLPEESADQAFFYKNGSCTRNLTDTKKQLQCIDCTRRQGKVYVRGACLKPEDAAKKARTLGLAAAEKPAELAPVAKDGVPVAKDAVPAAPGRTVKPGENLLVNGGFEDAPDKVLGTKHVSMPAEWALQVASQLDEGIVVAPAGAHGGKQGLEFHASTKVTTSAKLEPGQKYRLTFWAKASGVTPAAKLKSTIKVGTAEPNKVRPVDGTPVTEAAKDWTQVTIDFAAGPAEDFAKLELSSSLADKTGSFAVDDVELMLAP